MIQFRFIIYTIFSILILTQPQVFAQTVDVGKGSYSTTLPAGAIGPQRFDGAPISPKTSTNFTQPIQTNDFWSSLIFPFFGDNYSAPLYAHPLTAKAVNSGLQIGYQNSAVLTGSDYLYPYSADLTVGTIGLNATSTTTDSYSDWVVTAQWKTTGSELYATLGHGLPFIYFQVTEGIAQIDFNGSPTIWYNNNGVLGVTVNGNHYGIFGPSESQWIGTDPLQSDLNNKEYLSVGVLPDATEETLEFYRKRAYAFVTDTQVDWNYDQASSELTTNYSFQTELKENDNGNLNEPLTALYRHQWLYSDIPFTDYSYQSPRGEMKVFSGSSFSTNLRFSGILPGLPDMKNYEESVLLSLVRQVAQEELGVGPTYENGKAMGRFAQLVHIADQIGATAERDYFLSELKKRLEEWLSVGGPQEYSYNTEWDVLTGYPSGFGADREINDHHFHSSYAIRSAATIAQYDPNWASQENWGAMINLLIKDANNWDRSDLRFPFLRSHDAYAGHSWASGHGAFGDGNNQESSSESMNFASAVILWGSITRQTDIRDLGIFLHTNEMIAIEQYWFDVDNAVFPENFNHLALGIVWGGKGVHGTWFGSDPEFIHGINFLPLNSGSMYLGRHPDYVIQNYAEIVAERNGNPVIWKDVLWQYLALSDAQRALSLYNSDPNYQPFDGESRAHTMYWLNNFVDLGQPNTTVTADVPEYSVFVTEQGDTTYAAFNPASVEQLVSFSDGFTLSVPAKKLVHFKTDNSNTVSNEQSESSPLSITLSENYPNPFNPTTTFTYSLPTGANVAVEVFNSLGQKVAVLLDEYRSAGQHQVTFDASGLSSGIYIYTIKANGIVKTGKMTLLK
jgi:endoglucanase Acf2